MEVVLGLPEGGPRPPQAFVLHDLEAHRPSLVRVWVRLEDDVIELANEAIRYETYTSEPHKWLLVTAGVAYLYGRLAVLQRAASRWEQRHKEEGK